MLALFPARAEYEPPLKALSPAADLEEDYYTTKYDIIRLRAKNTAPGPDGVPGCALVIALKELELPFRRHFSASLELGQFPTRWKVGRLVLLS